jgi:hypothetical protein
MKRSSIHSAALSAAVLTLATSAPAFAEEYYYDGGGDAAAGFLGLGIMACIWIPALLLGHVPSSGV